MIQARSNGIPATATNDYFAFSYDKNSGGNFLFIPDITNVARQHYRQ